MPSLSTSVNYERDLRPDKTARPAAAGDGRTGARPRTSQAAVEAPVSRPADFAAVEEFLQLLARAVRQFHTYPATSPLCTDAIAACHKVFASLDGRDRLAFRVTPRELIVDDIGIGAGTIVEHELVRRLHRAHVAALDIDRSASPRDLSRFCTDVLRCDDLVKTKTTFAELLAEHGVDTIAPHLAHRPEVLEVGAPPAARSHLVSARAAPPPGALAAARTGQLSVSARQRMGPARSRVDFDTSRSSISPSSSTTRRTSRRCSCASPTMRRAAESRDAALQQKFSDVATLFAALDPPLARVMFSKLARAVLDLGPERRTDLLRRTILPGLLDGRADGTVLRDFPERRPRRIAVSADGSGNRGAGTADDRAGSTRPAGRAPAGGGAADGGAVARRATRQRPGAGNASRTSIVTRGRLIRGRSGGGQELRRLRRLRSLDRRPDDGGARPGSGVDRRAPICPSRSCAFLLNLVRLEPNPALADAFLRRSLTALAELERAARQRDLAAWAAQYRPARGRAAPVAAGCRRRDLECAGRLLHA